MLKYFFNSVFHVDLSDLKSELYSVHTNAYNNAYETEVYDLVMEGLGEFFSSRIDEVQNLGKRLGKCPLKSDNLKIGK